MSWLLFAFVCAFCEGMKDVLSKHSLRSLDTLSVSWVFFLLTTILCSPLVFLEEIPELGPYFWHCLFSHATLFGLSVYLYMKAISLSELSLTVPLIMITPVFMLVTGPIGLGEWPTPLGLVGTLLIVTGSYLLNIRNIRQGALAPFKALLSEPGARLMLLVAVIWSVTSIIDKLGIQNSSPTFWGVSLYALVSLAMTLLLLLRGNFPVRRIYSAWRVVIPVGVFNGVQLISYVFAMQAGLAVYVLAIKRCSVLLVLVLGALLFGESRIRERLFAVLIMLAGVFCIAFG